MPNETTNNPSQRLISKDLKTPVQGHRRMKKLECGICPSEMSKKGLGY